MENQLVGKCSCSGCVMLKCSMYNVGLFLTLWVKNIKPIYAPQFTKCIGMQIEAIK